MSLERLEHLSMEELRPLAVAYVNATSNRTLLEEFIENCRGEMMFNDDEDDEDDPYPDDFIIAW